MIGRLARIRAWAARRRRPLTAAASLVFLAGLGLSVWSLEIDPARLTPGPVLLILCVLAPLTLVVAAVSLQLSARALGRRIGLREGLAVSALGSIAELLPLPGGAMVRGAALVRAGAGLGESTWLVTLTGVLMVAMAAALGSVPLIAAGSAVGYGFLVAGAGGTAVAVVWIARRAGVVLTMAMLALRLAGLAVSVARLTAAFAAIGLAVGPVEAALFAVGATLGQSVSIVPAGLGLGEALAAALALLVRVPPAGAFLAVALSRVLGLAVCGLAALALIRNPLSGRADMR